MTTYREYVKNNAIKKLDINEEDKQHFEKLRDNFYITDTLYLKDNKKYRVKIELDTQSLVYLFGDYDNLTEKDLVYTVKVGNKILLKKVKKEKVLKFIDKEFKEEK